MKIRQLAVVVLMLFIVGVSHSAAAAKLKMSVFVYTEPPAAAKTADGFVDFVDPSTHIAAPLLDSVRDVKHMIASGLNIRNSVLNNAKSSDKAQILLRVVSREETDLAYIVRATATYKDHEFALVGSSTRQWKLAAQDLAVQLAQWVFANQAKLLSE